MDKITYYAIAMSISIVAIVLFVVLNTIFLKNKSEKTKLIPIIIVFFLLIALEVWKIFTLIKDNGHFEPLRYPLVMCSLVMFTYPIFCFKRNRFSNLAMAFSVLPVIGMFVAFVAVQYNYIPTLMQHHSYLYHAAMMAVAVYLITSGLYKFKFKDFFKVGIALIGYVAFCTILSLIIGADISIFGPEKGQLKFLYSMFGYGVGNLMVSVIMMGASAGVYAIICGFMQLARKNKENSNTQNEQNVKEGNK